MQIGDARESSWEPPFRRFIIIASLLSKIIRLFEKRLPENFSESLASVEDKAAGRNVSLSIPIQSGATALAELDREPRITLKRRNNRCAFQAPYF